MTAKYDQFSTIITNAFGDLIDNYKFFCASATCTSNLMWAHYASNHQGFCIEFRADKLPADKVTYQKEIPKIDTASLIPAYMSHEPPLDQLGLDIWQALRIKLDEWGYEEEYRCQLSKFSNFIELNKYSSKLDYPEDFIESIIFGCRTPESTKEFIIKSMPYQVKYKQAVELTSTIKIEEYKSPRLHQRR